MFEGKNKAILIGAGVILICGVALAVYSLTAPQKSEAPAPTKVEDTNVVNAAAVVEITDKGFVPETIKVSPGTVITWTNKDQKPHWVASDPYPTNNGLDGFDGKEAIQKDESYSFNFSKAGTFGYHDNLNPYTIKGTVIVE